jgi:MFS family permease
MRLGAYLDPVEELSPDDRQRGIRLLVVEAAFSASVGPLTSGVLLVAFAMHLGASNLIIGLLAAIPFLTQLLQMPAILIVDRTGSRKRIAVATSIGGRATLLLVAAAALANVPWALWVLVASQLILCSLSALGGCAWNSWLRDLVPADQLGQTFGKRLAVISGVGLAVNLLVALVLGQAGHRAEWVGPAYAAMFATGGILGIISAFVVARMPEPELPKRAGSDQFARAIIEPLKAPNFRRLLRFVASWQFTANLAAPFFVVMMVKQMGFSTSFALIATSISQLANLACMRFLTGIADRFANKTILSIAVPGHILCLVGMIGASQLERDAAQALVLLLHLLFGAATAGVTLATTNLVLKLSPGQSPTAYGASNAIATALAAGSATLLGGAFADLVGRRELELLIRWIEPSGGSEWMLSFGPWEFHFALASALGLYALHRLSLVEEIGEASRRQLLEALGSQARQSVLNLSSVAGLRALSIVPMGIRRTSAKAGNKPASADRAPEPKSLDYSSPVKWPRKE